MDEYITLLHDELLKAKEQVKRNEEHYKKDRHQSHNDYAEGIADGLQQAYDLLCKQVAKDLARRREGGDNDD